MVEHSLPGLDLCKQCVDYHAMLMFGDKAVAATMERTWLASKRRRQGETDSRIAHVLGFANDMVAVFDRDGQQMVEYQGKREDVVGKLEKAGWPESRWER
jgi:hypothetical protein